VCIDRLARDGAPHNATRLVLNWVDTERFTPRAPLPAEPRRALVFSNYASERTQLPAIREACARAGLALDVIGSGAGTGTTRPEDLLARYDIVFAKAKAAMEAMAVGAAVILCDYSGAGPMVTSQDFDRLRPLNFGFAALTNPLAAEPLAAEIARYDAADATRVRDRIRGEASLQHSVRSMVELYREVIAEHDPELHAPRPRIREPLVQRLEWAWRSIPDHRRAAIERFPGVTQLRLGARRVLRMQD
jgi:hypothetical protein